MSISIYTIAKNLWKRYGDKWNDELIKLKIKSTCRVNVKSLVNAHLLADCRNMWTNAPDTIQFALCLNSCMWPSSNIHRIFCIGTVWLILVAVIANNACKRTSSRNHTYVLLYFAVLYFDTDDTMVKIGIQ